MKTSYLAVIIAMATLMYGCQWRADVPKEVSLVDVLGAKRITAYGEWGPDLRSSGLNTPGADGHPDMREVNIAVEDHRIVVTAKAYNGFWDLIMLPGSVKTEEFASLVRDGKVSLHGDSLMLVFDGPYKYINKEHTGIGLIDIVPLGKEYVSFYIERNGSGYNGGIRFFERSNGRGERDLRYQSEETKRLMRK